MENDLSPKTKKVVDKIKFRNQSNTNNASANTGSKTLTGEQKDQVEICKGNPTPDSTAISAPYQPKSADT